MRGEGRLKASDLKRIQKNHKDRLEKQAKGLMQLIDMPEFDVSDLLQILTKNPEQSPHDLLELIPKNKLISFFTRNHQSFLITQQELLDLKIPELLPIPKAKQFHFQEPIPQKKQENVEEAAVMEIVNGFSEAVLLHESNEVLRLYKMIKEMKAHRKYQKYLEMSEIDRICRQSYEAFVQDCSDPEILNELGQPRLALKKHLYSITSDFLSNTQQSVSVDTSKLTLKKTVGSMINTIEKTLAEVKVEYGRKSMKEVEIDILFAEWIHTLVEQYYGIVEGFIYGRQQMREMLEFWLVVLTELEGGQEKGLGIVREIKSLIAIDLPKHINKVIEVVIEAFEDILKQNNRLYEFKYFDNLSSFSESIHELQSISPDQFDKKCCSQKGILLINSFALILCPLCDDQWSFLHANVLESLLNKVSPSIMESNWLFWDYYHLYVFFDRLYQGKVKNQRLFVGNAPNALQTHLSGIKNLAFQCWDLFQTKLSIDFWTNILSKIPQLLWSVRIYFCAKQRSSAFKPTVFSLDLFFKIEELFKRLEFRMERGQFEHIVLKFYEYIIYIIEYVLYWSYHDRGSKEKVFVLAKKSEKIYRKVKLFAVEELDVLKENKKLLTISHVTKIGLEQLALDLYFLTEGMIYISKYGKLECEQAVIKMGQIEAKQHKGDPVNLEKTKYTEDLKRFMKVLVDQPYKLKQYLQNKRKQSG